MNLTFAIEHNPRYGKFVKDWLCRNYHCTAFDAGDIPVELYISTRDIGGRHFISFGVNKVVDFETTYDLEAAKLGRFSIDMDKALGEVDWQHYLMSKLRGEINVFPPAEHRARQAFEGAQCRNELSGVGRCKCLL